MVAGLAVLVDAAGVVVGAEVVEAGGGVGEQVPDDHQDRAGDGDQGLELADAPDQAAVALPEEGVGLGGRGGDLAEHALEVGVALAGGAGAVLGAGLDGPWATAWPTTPGARGWELAHVQPNLGDDDLGGLGADAGDLVQTLQRPSGGWAARWLALAPVVPIVAPAGWARSASLGAWAAGMAAISSSIRAVRRSIWAVRASMLVQQHPRQLGVVVVEAAGRAPPPARRACRASAPWPARRAPWGRAARRSAPPAWPAPRPP